jgi:CopG family nickel-responsive transcriptional regulator
MEHVERIGVSLEPALLAEFDKIIAAKGYKNRSEAIRDLIRNELSKEKLASPKSKAIAAVCLVYDHHQTELMRKMTDLQHSHLLHTICTMHVHLDKHDCMEVIVLKGAVGEIERMADTLISLKGVKLGKINLISSATP